MNDVRSGPRSSAGKCDSVGAGSDREGIGLVRLIVQCVWRNDRADVDAVDQNRDRIGAIAVVAGGGHEANRIVARLGERDVLRDRSAALDKGDFHAIQSVAVAEAAVVGHNAAADELLLTVPQSVKVQPLSLPPYL